uniref:Uncharacterized protein n=1 Tax=Phakopsora pachyrhizi TaxID=170000 RepID=A0A0S1MJY6_PHAPC
MLTLATFEIYFCLWISPSLNPAAAKPHCSLALALCRMSYSPAS